MPSAPPTALRTAQGPGLTFDHLGKQGQANRNHLAGLGQFGHRLIQKAFLIRAQGTVRQSTESPPERC